MLSFVASQAVALSQVKRRQGSPAIAAQAHVGPESPRRKSLFATVFDALFESRVRKLKFEITAHRQTYRNGINK
jgi:hypothetical protein